MTNLNLTDLLVRLQLSGCKYGELANRFADDLKYGKKCAHTNMRNLLLLNAYIELLECYTPLNSTETLATGYFQFQAVDLTNGPYLELFVNGESISGVFTPTSTNNNTEMTALGNQINAYQSTYVATGGINPDNGKPQLIITGTCKNDSLICVPHIPFGNKTWYKLGGLTGGVCATTEEDNCLTEEQVQNMLNTVSKLTGLCFQAAGFEYAEAVVVTKPCKKYSITTTVECEIMYRSCADHIITAITEPDTPLIICSLITPSAACKADIVDLGDC